MLEGGYAVAHAGTQPLERGTIADIAARLTLWSRNAPRGLVRVEFSSEFARQQVVARLAAALKDAEVPFHEIDLPSAQPPQALLKFLLERLDALDGGVVSIHGFATAFAREVPLSAGLYALNLNREVLAQRPLRQIWWMTPPFASAVVRTIRDLDSWFILRLRLTESMPRSSGQMMMLGNGLLSDGLLGERASVNIDEARSHSDYLLQRFHQALAAGDPAAEVFRVYGWPAIEALLAAKAERAAGIVRLAIALLLGRFPTPSPHVPETSIEPLLAPLSSQTQQLLSQLKERFPEIAVQLETVEPDGADWPSIVDAIATAAATDPDLAASLQTLTALADQLESVAQNSDFIKAIPDDNSPTNSPTQTDRPEHPESNTVITLTPLEVARALNNQAKRYYGQGRYREAEPLYLQALEITQHQFGADHPNTIICLGNLASLYYSQGRYREAEPLFQHTLEIRQRQLSNDHPDTATSLNNLASLYSSQGHYGDAETLYLQALESRQRQLGDDHPDTANSLNNLATLYELQERYEEAELLHLKALEIYQHLLGNEHPRTANTLNNLAKLYNSQGRYGEAESFHLKALEIRQHQLGNDHPATANSLNNLASLYSSQGRYGDAEPLYLQALEIRQRQLGDNHPDIANSFNNLAKLYDSQGRYGDAEPLYLQALEICEQHLGPEHPHTAKVRDNLDRLHRQQAESQER